MKIAWVAHHNLKTPGGGAEFTDKEMIERRPEGVEVDVLHPREFRKLATYDRVVVSRLEEASGEALAYIAGTKPVFFSHGDVLPRSVGVKLVVLQSRPFIAQTPLSLLHITRWTGTVDGFAMVPYMDMEGIRSEPKEHFALWPHRNVEHKGLDLAREWASRQHVPLVVMSGRPREDVLSVMAAAKYVVLFSKILDGCPRAIREAQLSECTVVVNDLVGVWDLPPEELRERTLDAPRRFWKEIIGA